VIDDNIYMTTDKGNKMKDIFESIETLISKSHIIDTVRDNQIEGQVTNQHKVGVDWKAQVVLGSGLRRKVELIIGGRDWITHELKDDMIDTWFKIVKATHSKREGVSDGRKAKWVANVEDVLS